MGDGTGLVQASNVLDDYSVIYLDGSNSSGLLFRCATGLGPIGEATNNMIGDIYYNNVLLTDGVCSGLIQPSGEENTASYPGVYQALLCSALTTSTEGVYTCTLTNSSGMQQSVRVGVYFNGRSELYYNIRSFIIKPSTQLLQ